MTFSVKYLHVVSILHTLSPFRILMWLHFTVFPSLVSWCGSHFSPSRISMRFPFYALFHREVSPCGFHFTHYFTAKYLHAVSILRTFSPRSISVRFPFYTLFHREISTWGFQTFSRSGIYTRFPLYTLFHREVSPCGFHFTQFFVPKNGVVVFKLNWHSCNLRY